VQTVEAENPRRGLSNGLFAFLLILPSFLVVFFIILYPLANALFTSFFRYFLTEAVGMRFIGLKNYVTLVSSPSFWTAFLNTVVYVGGTVGGEFVFAFLLALLVNYRFRFKNALNSLFFVPWIMPSVTKGPIT
jgi:multiple sugar transport system permease protein